ncbi:MAG: hypothetical protein FJZ63_00450 [Chlamydiae bacterium]|nr:hypothetical protein [Chlamydiota bacterium]
MSITPIREYNISKVSHGGNPLNLKKDDLDELKEKINSIVESQVFQDKTKNLNEPVQLVFENGTVKLKYRDAKNQDHVDDITSDLENKPTLQPTATGSGTTTQPPKAKTLQESIEFVSNLANYYFQSTAKAPNTTSPHGINNDTNKACYAISAYQLVNCTSLKDRYGLTDKKYVQNYETMQKGSDLIKALNDKVFTSKQHPLTPLLEDTIGEADRVLHGLVAGHAGIKVKNTSHNNKENTNESNDQDLHNIISIPSDKSFEEGVKQFASNTELNESNQPLNVTITQQFITAPTYLIINRTRNEGAPKISEDSSIPQELDVKALELIDKQTNPSPEKLHLEGFISYHTTNPKANNGHYTTYYKKENKWYHANDNIIQEVMEADWKEALKTATSLYYAVPADKAEASEPTISYMEYLSKEKTKTTAVATTALSQSSTTSNSASSTANTSDNDSTA